mmetsp:Transcript_88644/g.248033  ORF Transcript_88644/g.248033 Transcript_88644/m.248033 type:complete len:214 (-) Transcript_88644:244-885(-)
MDTCVVRILLYLAACQVEVVGAVRWQVGVVEAPLHVIEPDRDADFIRMGTWGSGQHVREQALTGTWLQLEPDWGSFRFFDQGVGNVIVERMSSRNRILQRWHLRPIAIISDESIGLGGKNCFVAELLESFEELAPGAIRARGPWCRYRPYRLGAAHMGCMDFGPAGSLFKTLCKYDEQEQDAGEDSDYSDDSDVSDDDEYYSSEDETGLESVS